jgi:hypothetical protein
MAGFEVITGIPSRLHLGLNSQFRLVDTRKQTGSRGLNLLERDSAGIGKIFIKRSCTSGIHEHASNTVNEFMVHRTFQAERCPEERLISRELFRARNDLF